MNKHLFFISFFTFSGFYAVLAILISLGMTGVTRYVNVPLRLLTTIVMLYVFLKALIGILLKDPMVYMCFYFVCFGLFI